MADKNEFFDLSTLPEEERVAAVAEVLTYLACGPAINVIVMLAKGENRSLHDTYMFYANGKEAAKSVYFDDDERTYIRRAQEFAFTAYSQAKEADRFAAEMGAKVPHIARVVREMIVADAVEDAKQ